MRYILDAALTAADATQATQTSSAIDATSVVAASVHVVAAGATITGTAKVQVSNDPVGVPVNWVDLSGASVSVTGAGNFLIPKFDATYQWMRVVYTKTTSAAGALITANVKTIGY